MVSQFPQNSIIEEKKSNKTIISFAYEEDLDNIYDFYCWIDHAMNSFEMVKDSHYKGRDVSECKAVKPHFTTKYNARTSQKIVTDFKTLDGLVDIVIGSTERETDTNIAYTLRNFRGVIRYQDTKKLIVQFEYGYSIIRDTRALLIDKRATFERLRNGNNQKS